MQCLDLFILELFGLLIYIYIIYEKLVWLVLPGLFDRDTHHRPVLIFISILSVPYSKYFAACLTWSSAKDEMKKYEWS